MSGLVLAVAIGGAGYPVLVVERAPLTVLTSAPYDGRVTAVARGARRFLEEIGAWPGMAEAAAPILDIVVREGFSPIEVHYDHRSVGAEPLGHIVENRAIRGALIELARSLPMVTLAAPAETGTAGTVGGAGRCRAFQRPSRHRTPAGLVRGASVHHPRSHRHLRSTMALRPDGHRLQCGARGAPPGPRRGALFP